jgi:hypothetical protein
MTECGATAGHAADAGPLQGIRILVSATDGLPTLAMQFLHAAAWHPSPM